MIFVRVKMNERKRMRSRDTTLQRGSLTARSCFVYESRLITDEYNDRGVMNDRQENRPLLTLVPYN